MVLALSVLGTTCFFLARWGINAAGLGRHDAGWALLLSFASVLATYACAALAVLSAILGAGALLRERPWLAYAWAFLVAALPLAYLAFR